MKKQNISDAVIRRLPRYYRHLDDLCSKGVLRISSHSLGIKMGITASQIRQDFSCFGEFGQQGYGYNVADLRMEIGRILGADQNHSAIVIGVGNLGHALIQNFLFSHTGFTVGAAFDISPQLIGTKLNDIPVLSMDELANYVSSHKVDVAVLTVPQNIVQGIVNDLIGLGIRGFWNFTNIELETNDPSVYIENIHFSDSLLTLSYRISNR